MDNKSKTLAKNLGILTLSNFASKFLVFLLVPLYTSVLTTEEYGIYDIVVSTISLLLPLISLNIIDAVMRFLIDRSYNKTQVASIGFYYVFVSLVIFTLGVFVLSFLPFGEIISGYELFIVFYYISYVLNQFCIQVAKGLDCVRELGVSGVLGTITMILFNVIFLCYFKLRLSGFFMANILAQLIPICYIVFSLRLWNYIRLNKLNKHLKKEMLTYCVPLIASVVGWWANSGSDRYVVTFFCGVSANGLLSVAYKIPSILNTCQSVFIQAWQISAIKEYGQTDTKEFYGQTFTVINLSMVLVCSVLTLLTRPLAYVMYANNFYSAWKYVPFLLISSVLNCASGFLGPILSAKKDSKTMARSAVIGALVNVILNIMLVYFLGIQGVTIATVIASFVIYELRRRAVITDFKINSSRLILLSWSLLCIQACFEIFEWSILFEISTMFLLCFLNKKSLFKILYFMKTKAKELINRS